MIVDDDVSDISTATLELYEREHLAMVRLARLLVGSVALAEEAVHDAFITVLERRATIVDPGAYLRKVVVNNCWTVTRRAAIGRRKVAVVAGFEHTRSLQLTPELDETWAALSLVTPKQRTALKLRFYGDLAVNDIAEMMDERPGTIKSLLHRGLATLRKELSQ